MNKFEHIRRKFGVPAKHRARVYVKGLLAEIVGVKGQMLVVRMAGDGESRMVHPLYGVEYDTSPRPKPLRSSLKNIGGSINGLFNLS